MYKFLSIAYNVLTISEPTWAYLQTVGP